MIRCYVTDRRQGNLLAHVARAVAGGVDMIQVREKDLDAAELFSLVCQVRDAAGAAKTKIMVNGRLDVALAAGIDGVHLPGDGLPAAMVRPHVRWLGVSTHSMEEAVRAERDGADYVFFGPVFETPAKEAVGTDALRRVVAAVRIPVLAIGGIDASNTAAIMETGAAGVAAIRMFQSA
jgi:thiamine-phosphate pyrophosphorylase